MAKTILVCVAWPYANSSLHLGHIAGTWLPADIFARYHRLKGNRVLMVSGSDEHGTPITVTAEQEHKNPQQIVDFFHSQHHEGLKALNISIDCYFRTSHPDHQIAAQQFFTTLKKANFIDERSSEALFCPSCARFLPDRYVVGTCPNCAAVDARGDQCDRCGKTLDPADLKNPKCRLCGQTPIFRETRLHYLLLSKLEPALGEFLSSRKSWRSNVLNFTRNWIKEGLHDRAITRDLSWGVPVPLDGFNEKRLYVWFEAVIGYLSATQQWAKLNGHPDSWREFWQDPSVESFYFIGKDNIPFHTIIWPAMLLAHGGLNLPTNVPANEYLLVSGEKFSKSRGIGAKLTDCLAEFQPDQIRYYLTSIMPETSDADFSWDGFVSRNNDELLSVIGNLMNRILSFAQRTYASVPALGEITQAERSVFEAIERCAHETGLSIERCEFKKAFKEVFILAQTGNQYVNAQAPWKLAKENPQRANTVMHTAIKLCQALTVFLEPFVPATARAAWTMMGFTGDIPLNSWDRFGGDLPANQKLGAVSPLIKRIERESADVAHL